MSSLAGCAPIAPVEKTRTLYLQLDKYTCVCVCVINYNNPKNNLSVYPHLVLNGDLGVS